MKIRTFKYIVKEGFFNIYKNKLMSLASIGIVTASLVVFGIFLLVIVNLNYNTDIINQQPEMQVFCEYDLDDTQVGQTEQAIKENGNVEGCTLVTPGQAFDNFKQSLGEDADVLEGFDDSLMSASFIIKLKNPQMSAETIEQLKKISGVRKISYSKDVVEVISKLTHWVNVISGFLIIILLAVSVFIISNTIKLTVFARRKEINIMKYIGATDWFIRWPFVIEGVIIGIIGAIVAFLLTHYGYGTIESKFNNDLMNISKDFIRLVRVAEINAMIILLYSLIGGIVGAVGSFVSIRKYLRV